MSQTIQSLSLGEKKKIMLIATFLTDAKLYVMDEPFSGLDENSLKELYELIGQSLQSGKEFIIVTHGHSDKLPAQSKTIYL